MDPDYQELGISKNASLSVQDIRRAFKQKVKVTHPDRGGRKEDFQNLSNAYERLLKKHEKKSSTADRATASNSGVKSKARNGNSRHGYDDNSVSDAASISSDYFDESNKSDDDDFFYMGSFDPDKGSFKQREDAAYAKRRRNNVKAGYDRRDKRAKAAAPSGSKKGEGNCMTCSINYGITRRSANSSGLNWSEYSNHPRGLRTCWACKNFHKSVITRNMALKKYSRILKSTVFDSLQSEGKFFRHKPVYHYSETNESTYFWVFDLELEASKKQDDKNCISVLSRSYGGCEGQIHSDCFSSDVELRGRNTRRKRKRRARNLFTKEEKNAIVEGVEKFGRAWRTILREYKTVLSSCRTDVDIKDCYRNLTKNKANVI